MDYKIKLPLFEGPFDLLLFFIERDELNIYDIPISQITQDFLNYIKHLEEINMEVSSEFILVAATLINIKAKMLLPRSSTDCDGNEIDPRDELVTHLLEYKKYKLVAKELIELEEKRLQKFIRGNLQDELKKIAILAQVEAELQEIDLYKLLKTYEKVISKHKKNNQQTVHTIIQYPYTIEQQKKIILNEIEQKNKLSFNDLIKLSPDRIAFIFNFLAILELLQTHEIGIYISEGYNSFWIYKLH